MPQLVSPYKDIEQHTVIKIEPYQMNSDILINAKLNLKNKVENKCNRQCFIMKVHKILKMGEGTLHAENFSGGAIYPISYHAQVCLPINNTFIIGKVSVLNKKLIVVVNGPLRIFIPKNNIESSNFIVKNDLVHKKTNKIIEVESLVKILLINHRISQNASEINSIGILHDIATDKEIESCYGDIKESNDNFISLSDDESNEPEKPKQETNFII